MQIHLCESGFDEVCNIILRHALFEGCERGAEDIEGGFASETHQFKLMRGFVSTAGDGDGIGGGVFEPWRGLAQMIEKGEAGGLLDADASGANILVCQRFGGDFRRALVFLPNADVDWQMEFFAKPSFFKARDHKTGTAHARDDKTHEALAKPPANPCEVVKRSAGREEERVVFCGL